MKNEKPENKGEVESTIQGLIEYFNEYFGNIEDKEASVHVDNINENRFKIVLGYTTRNIPYPSHEDPTLKDEDKYNKREQFSWVWNTDMTLLELVREVDKCLSYIKDVKVVTNFSELEDDGI